MTTEQSVADADSVVVAGPTGVVPVDGGDYWHSLIDEKAAADFLNVTTRTMQSLRQRGGGPRFMRLSARCIRYTRAGLKAWAEEHVRGSTADTGPDGDA